MLEGYISREAAVKAANEWVSEACMAPVMRVSRLFDKLAKVPAADVVPVVRCKDCVHCGFCGDATNLQVMGFYGFCSRGERKDGGDSDAKSM